MVTDQTNQTKFYDFKGEIKEYKITNQYYNKDYIEKTVNNIKTLYTMNGKNPITKYKTILIGTDKLLMTADKIYDTGLVESTLYKITNQYYNKDYIEKTINNIKTLYSMDGTKTITNYKPILIGTDKLFMTADKIYDTSLVESKIYKHTKLYNKDYIEKIDNKKLFVYKNKISKPQNTTLKLSNTPIIQNITARSSNMQTNEDLFDVELVKESRLQLFLTHNKKVIAITTPIVSISIIALITALIIIIKKRKN